MKILSIDSCTNVATAAILDDEVLVAEFVLNNQITHSTKLLPQIENMMNNAEIKFSDIDVFAVTTGPGSFTGVRIGAATVKGLAFAENKPCVAVSPLEAMARTIGRGYVCPVMDARRDQFYTALFKDGVRITEDSALSAEEIKKLIADLPEVVICGDGRDKFLTYCEGMSNLFPASDAMSDQNALSVALCGFDAFEKGSAVSPESLQPVYLRMPQAERERLEREKSGD